MKIHKLKTINPHFEDVWNGVKTAELRFNDRGFEVGDKLELREYDPINDTYSGREIHVFISHILQNFEGLNAGWVMLCFESKSCVLGRLDVFVVTAQRHGNNEKHSYLVGVFNNENKAIAAAEAHANYRGGNYGCVVEKCDLNHFDNNDNNYSKEVYRALSRFEKDKS